MEFGVSAAKANALALLMQRLGIREEDIEERFVRAAGPGGQNINKTATAVFLRHRPSGIDVKCQETRSQALNRFLARRLLCQKLQEMVEGRRSAEQARIARLRRQKRRRSRRAQQKVLENKRRRALVKERRRSPTE